MTRHAPLLDVVTENAILGGCPRWLCKFAAVGTCLSTTGPGELFWIFGYNAKRKRHGRSPSAIRRQHVRPGMASIIRPDSRDGSQQRKRPNRKPRPPRLDGVLKCDPAISDIPNATCVLERGCAVCVVERTFCETQSATWIYVDCRAGATCICIGSSLYNPGIGGPKGLLKVPES